MYGLAYVLVPPAFSSLKEELDRSLAPFKRGGRDDFPPEVLEFEDCEPWLRKLWAAELTLARENGQLSVRGEGDGWVVSSHVALGRWLDETGRQAWTGRLCEVEPDYGRFVDRFSTAPLDPVSGRYGTWHNRLGHWDWWELGGRFDGVVTGEPRKARDDGVITSGPDAGRALLGNLGRALLDELGGELSDDRAEIEANVELASTVRRRLQDDADAFWPTAIVRPVGAAPDVARWIESASFRPPPVETRLALGLDPDVEHRDVVLAALHAHDNAAVAGVAYHC